MDVVILGSGFSGALLAWIGARRGYRVLLLERGQHPRFVIGESSTPLANLLLEEIADEFGLPELHPFSKWGTWQREHPTIAVGLKRGFSFFHHSWNQAWVPDSNRRNELLVAANPSDELADTHWYRPDFDWHLVGQATAAGASYWERVSLDSIIFHSDTVEIRGSGIPNPSAGPPPRMQSEVSEGNRPPPLRDPVRKPFFVRTDFVLDASHRGSALGRFVSGADTPLEQMPEVWSCFGHFTGVQPWPHRTSSSQDSCEKPPFGPNDAALHHVFPGGWMWVLPFNNGITSAGFLVTRDHIQACGLELTGTSASADRLWQQLLEGLPSVYPLFARAKPVQPLQILGPVGFQKHPIVGPRWALLPSSAGFVDPLLSTGFPLNLLGVQRLARSLFPSSNKQGVPFQAPTLDTLEAYQCQTQLELQRTATLIGALYRTFEDPAAFQALIAIYFAAASFTEITRRLRRTPKPTDPAPDDAASTTHRWKAAADAGFLLAKSDEAWTLWEACCREAGTIPASELQEKVRQAIDPWNVAGLLGPARRNWYPCDISDLDANHHKLGASLAEIHAMLRHCGFLS